MNGNHARAPPRVSLKRAIFIHLKVKKLESAKWLIRVMINLCGIVAFIPWVFDCGSCFKMVLFLNTAVCLLRLIQRLNDNKLTADFISNPFGEDAMQYILYSWIFYGITPCVMFVAVLPVILYNALAVFTYAYLVISVTECGARFGVWETLRFLQAQGVRVFCMVAFLEFFLMFAVLLMAVLSMTTMLVPCAYSYFLTCRLYSRRNRYSREMFLGMRITINNVVRRLHAFFDR